MSGTIYKGTNVANFIDNAHGVKRIRVYKHVPCITRDINSVTMQGANYFDVPRGAQVENQYRGAEMMISLVKQHISDENGFTDFQDVIVGAVEALNEKNDSDQSRRYAALGFFWMLDEFFKIASTQETLKALIDSHIEVTEEMIQTSLKNELEHLKEFSAQMLGGKPKTGAK